MNRLLSPLAFLLMLLWLCAVTVSPSSALATEGHKGAVSVPTLSEPALQQLLKETGQRAVLINFFASWCPPCREELPSLIALRTAYAPEDIAFIGISLDSDADVLNRFVRQQAFNYPVYQDDGSIAQALELNSIPFNVILDGKGNIVYAQPGMIPETMLRALIETALGRQ